MVHVCHRNNKAGCVSVVVTSAAAAACALQLSFCPGVVWQELQPTVAVVSSHALVLAC